MSTPLSKVGAERLLKLADAMEVAGSSFVIQISPNVAPVKLMEQLDISYSEGGIAARR